MTWAQIAAQKAPEAGQRIAYGEGALQFGELRVPEGAGPHPVAVILHGGCWRAAYDFTHITPVSDALTRSGIATWTVEYRRIGDAGGGWPGTFDDVSQAVDHLEAIATEHRLDLRRVVLAGHSAGGHLALWVAARKGRDALPVRGVVSLAGITDLRSYAAGSGNCNAAVKDLLGEAPAEVEDRYRRSSPIELVPLGVPQRLLHGVLDPIVPIAQSESFAERARAAGDDAQVVRIEGAGHFDVIAPFAPAWKAVLQAIRSLLGEARNVRNGP